MFDYQALRDTRAARRMTQQDVVDELDAIGVTTHLVTYKRWEGGVYEPDCTRFAALCKVLSVKPDVLVPLQKRKVEVTF